MNLGPMALDPNAAGGSADELALKCLEMAREEIVERMRSANQTLIVYAGAVGAILGWLYPKDVHQNRALTDYLANIAQFLYPVGILIAFLCLTASWVISHNEDMVSALAQYQVQDLAPYFRGKFPDVRIWECSSALGSADPGISVQLSLAINLVLVVGPPVALVLGMIFDTYSSGFSWSQLCAILASLILIGSAVYLWMRTYHLREALRKKQIAQRNATI